MSDYQAFDLVCSIGICIAGGVGFIYFSIAVIMIFTGKLK
jgi:preprotein translocase subunit Sss1